MWILTTGLLALAAALLLLRLLRHERALRTLQLALLRRQPLLREDLPGALGAAWDDLCGTANDLTAELRQLELQRRGRLTQLEATLGNLQEAVLAVDASNRVVLANQALQSIFPHASNILGQRLELVLSSLPFLDYLLLVREGRAKPQQEVEFMIGDQRCWIEATGTTIPALHDEDGPWVLFVLHNITKQKRLERVRKEFVANVSHELRTPLSVIKGYVETLEEGHEQMSLADRTHFLRTINRHTVRLSSLLDDLLTLSRLESGDPGLRLEDINMTSLVEEVVGDIRARPTAADRSISCDLAADLGEVRADPLKLTQVLTNLLDNAIKYSGKSAKIQVRGRRIHGEVTISVSDNGPGIPEADLPHIFERFYRVEKGRSRETGGTGLGLSIVKHIIQLHGGRVWVESHAGQGTTFTFAVPGRLRPLTETPTPTEPHQPDETNLRPNSGVAG